ncbi:MAG: methionine adenosyltransferase [bacterium]
MEKKDMLFTSESVTEGHPDKIADRISDSVLDALLEKDKNSRVACETMVTTGMALIAGEITSKAMQQVDIPAVARQAVKDIGYTDASMGFDHSGCAVLVSLDQQSPDIAKGVDESPSKDQGAGDQGMMFGYACNETPDLMPMPIHLAHRLTQKLASARKQKKLPWLRPDGKSQVSVLYKDGKPKQVTAVVVAAQHSNEVKNKEIKEGITEEIINKVIPSRMIQKGTKIHINPTGRFVIGGPHGDCGVTGRKIIVDTYGGMGRHGGGAFSGKDPSKVDRSATYMARYIAKNLVAARIAERCEVQIAYAIGVAQPVAVNVDVFGTGKLSELKIAELVRQHFDLRPRAIIEDLKLQKPIFAKTAAYGHFGRKEKEFTWERTDKAKELAAAAKKMGAK